MKDAIFTPEKINVGFQNREGTYTKKLAYIIYFDQKGKLRKETSWNNWRDGSLGNKIYENTPTSGFVLNKKAGGYSTGWNHRQTYVRVYDPRGFEFEISVPNLLYILENTNSIKGKGLEGEFVYGWDKADLVLIPTDSPDYKEIKDFNKILHSNGSIKVKDLVLGCSYLNKSNEEWVYMGRFDYYRTEGKWNDKEKRHNYSNVNKGKHHFFVRESKYILNNEKYLIVQALKSVSGRFISIASEECVENYADLMDKLERETSYSPIDDSKDEYLPYTLDEFKNKFKDARWEISFYAGNHDKKTIRLKTFQNVSDGIYERIEEKYEEQGYWGRSVTRTKYIDMPFNSVEEVYEKYKPHYLNKYLANGKLYQEGK